MYLRWIAGRKSQPAAAYRVARFRVDWITTRTAMNSAGRL